MITLLTGANAWAALAALSTLEIVLGRDNIVFISILVSRCTQQQAGRARQIDPFPLPSCAARRKLTRR